MATTRKKKSSQCTVSAWGSSISTRAGNIETTVKLTPFRHRYRSVLAIAALSTACVLVRAQEPPSASPETSAPAESGTAKSTRQLRYLGEFLIRGTVFTDKALSLPGAELRIRRTGEKKFRWNTYTNSRGEFAVRVPPGADYEVVVQAKGFAEAIQPVDAKNGLSEDNMVFHMDLATERKK